MVEGTILGIGGEQNILFIRTGGISDPRLRHLHHCAGTAAGMVLSWQDQPCPTCSETWHQLFSWQNLPDGANRSCG